LLRIAADGRCAGVRVPPGLSHWPGCNRIIGNGSA
jgi:hypothetical protein